MTLLYRLLIRLGTVLYQTGLNIAWRGGHLPGAPDWVEDERLTRAETLCLLTACNPYGRASNPPPSHFRPLMTDGQNTTATGTPVILTWKPKESA
jgi:hypothetical protein